MSSGRVPNSRSSTSDPAGCCRRRRGTHGRPGPYPRNLLTGIATCGKCGGPIKTNIRYPKGDKEPYNVYACRTNHCVTFPVETADSLLWSHVFKALADPAFRDAWTMPLDDEAAGVNVAELQREEATLQQRLADAAEDYADGKLSRDMLARIIARTEERLANARDALASAGGRYDLSDLLGDPEYVLQRITEMTGAQQRELALHVVESYRFLPRRRGSRIPDPRDVEVVLRTAADVRADS